MKRIQIVFIGVFIMFFFSCSKDKDNNDELIPSGNNDSIMIDILSEVSGDQKTFMDIAPIPIQAELYDFAEVDTNFQTVLDVIENFNDMIENPGILLGTSLKSTQAVNWDPKGCEEFGTISVCTWELDQGDYMYRVEQTMESTTGSVTLETFISGTYDGVFYGELGEDFYLISDWIITFNGLQTWIMIYFAPTHEGVYGEPVFSYLYAVGEGRTIYTPWGGSELIMNVSYQNIIYTWDGINGHHESILSLMEWEGDLLTTVVGTYCINYESLRPTYSSTYNFDDHEGAWCSYDCDGIPINCGSY
ncbi:hypothetical protein ES705_26401 [subsurface metagenome]